MTINDVGIQLVCGLPKAIGDTNSAEKGPFGDGQYIIDLLAFGSGFQISAEDWIPQVAASTPQRAGSGDIIGYTQADIQETINILVIGATPQVVNAKMKKLLMFRQLVEDFWVGTSIEPVYLEWKAAGSPGPQYALIKSFQAADNASAAEGSLTGEIVISLEREPYWRALPPGANPKLWTFEAQGLNPGADYDYTDMEINTGTDHLIYNASLANKCELDDPVTFGYPTGYISENFVDINADDAPGDIEAGMLLYLKDNLTATRSVLIGRKTVFPAVITSGGDELVHTSMMNACEASLGTTTTAENDTGGVIPMTGASAQRAKITFADTVTHGRLELPGGSGTVTQLNRFLGKYAVFARCRQVGAGTVNLHIRAGYGIALTADSYGYRLPESPTVPVIGTTGDTTEWGLVYFGVLDLPLGEAKAGQSAKGKGLKIVETDGDLVFILYAKASATTPTVYVSDVILIPIDEYAVSLSGGWAYYMDSSLYAARGVTEDFAGHASDSASSMNVATIESAGHAIRIKPGVKNRLYFLSYYNDGGVLKSKVSDTLIIRGNIIPRWSGRRDV